VGEAKGGLEDPSWDVGASPSLGCSPRWAPMPRSFSGWWKILWTSSASV
jgi:hypothetical protein